MVRIARKQSQTGVYHVMLRGINRQIIFEEEEDFEKFLEILSVCKLMIPSRIFGYCLMGNHAHVIISCKDRPLGDYLKRVGIRYASWFNRKYGRIGHLFQDRYRSEPIVDDRQLLAAIRYIHQNPVMSGLCRYAKDYPHSSYQCYIGDSGIVDTELVLGMLSEDVDWQKQAFAAFMLTAEGTVFIDDTSVRLTDREGIGIIKDIIDAESVSQFQELSRDKRDEALRQMRKRGLSIRQIARLTGIPFGVVRNK
jgi:REP element-mobilizing transposase RayT